MIPILYPPGATKDDTENGNGLGFLTDCFKCEVTEERNGSYEAVFQYPCTGELFSSIADGAIIKAKANETSEPQLFRIYKASAPMNGKVTYYAEHISYALNGLPIIGLHTTDKTAHTTMFQAFSACPIEHEFTSYSDIVMPNSINLDTPTSLRSFLGGDSGSMLDVFGGEFEFDNYTVNLWLHRGADNGVVIRYGKNLTDIKQERNISDCYTHLFPYATYKESVTDDDGNITETETTVTIADQVIELINPASVGHKKALIYDFSSEFSDDEEITPETLETKAQEYIESADLATPSVNITLSIAALWQSDEYNEQAVEHIKLCDTVHVIFENLGISATAKVIKTVYDSLKERYTTITIGSVKSNFATTVKTLTQNIENAEKQIRDQNTVLTTRLLIEDGRILGEITRATEAESLLSTKIQQTAEGLTAEVTRATEAEGTLTSLIDINAEAITAEVQRAEDVENTLSASIKVNADAISAEVTRAETAEETLTSSIKVNADAISAEVQRAEGAEDTLSASIKVNADAISAEVTRAKDEETAITAKIALGIDKDTNGNPYAYLNANADYIAFTANKYITISSKYFTLSADGTITATNAEIKGDITATSLTLSDGVTISTDNVDGLAAIATSGSYNDLTNKPTIPSLTGYIYTDGTIGSTPADGATGFVVSKAGLLQASNAIIYGKLYSSVGTIAGLTLSNKSLYVNQSTYNGTGSTDTAGVYLGTDGIGLGKGNFYVTSAGALYAKNADIEGKINCGEGTIGGLTIAENSISSGNGNFSITSTGVLNATDATISGEVNATSGTFTNVNISTTCKIGNFTVGYINSSGQPTTATAYSALYVSGNVALGENMLKYYDGASNYMSYSQMDCDGVGYLKHVNNTSDYPRLRGNYYYGGMEQYYYTAASTISSYLKVYLDSDDDYCPTISATKINVNAPICSNILPLTANTYNLGASSSPWNYIYTHAINLVGTDNANAEISADERLKITSPYIDIEGIILPVYDNQYRLGGPSFRWSYVYSAGGVLTSSDLKFKQDIESLSDKYTVLFDGLRPVRYKLKNDNKDHFHTGFIAQEIEEAIADADLNNSEFAAYDYDEESDSCSLNYSEIIALCVQEIQKLKQRVTALEQGA